MDQILHLLFEGLLSLVLILGMTRKYKFHQSFIQVVYLILQKRITDSYKASLFSL